MQGAGAEGWTGGNINYRLWRFVFGELCPPRWLVLLLRDEHGKRYGKKYDETEMEKMEKNRAREKIHSRGKKVFPLAPLDYLF